MSLPKMETDVKNIENLPKRPNATNGLDYKALQQVFDKAGVDIQSFLNNTLIPALDSGIGGVDIDALQEAQGADKEMAFPVYDPRVGVNAKLFIADILPFAVTVTKAASGAMTCDKTFALVRAAYNAGRPVFCIYTNEKEQWDPVILTLAECSSTSAIFSRYAEVYQGETWLARITLSESGAVDATTTIDASSVAYSGSVGEYSPKNVSAAIEALMNYTDDKVGSITEDATADYAASGASSVQAWATMAKTGSTTQYRVAAGEYRVTDAGDVYTLRIVDSTYTSWTVRRVEIVSSDDEANAYWSIYTATKPGLISYESIGIAGDGGGITLQGKPYQLPPLVTAADNGAFMRVSNGKWAAAQLTDVSEVGA